MADYEKVYVEVTLRVDPEGRIFPLSITWQDGTVYEIDRLRDVRPAPPDHVGAMLTRRYDCTLCGKSRTLWLETVSFRWFVEKPLTVNPE